MEVVVPLDRVLWPTLGDQVAAWMEANLVFGPGDLRGEALVLDEERLRLLYKLYEIHPRNHVLAGRRRFKRADVSLPKGVGKTEFGALVAAAELHPDAPVRFNGWNADGTLKPGRGVPDPYIPMVAYTEEQSDLLAYGALKTVLEESPIAGDFDIGLDSIRRIRGDGRAESRSAAPSSRDGARTTFQLMDETHHWTAARPGLKRAYTVMLQNLAKRKLADPWSLEITTAPASGEGSVAEDSMDYADLVKDGVVRDDTFFFYHRQASDGYDLDDPDQCRAAVIEASGATAEWRDVDAIVALRLDPNSDRNYWERVWLNRKVLATKAAFDKDEFAALHGASPVKPGDAITVGFDGAIFHDGTGVVATHVESGFQWLAGGWEKPYKAPDDWQVPVQEVDDCIRDLFRTYRVVLMFADPPYWQSYISTWAGDFGAETVREFWTNKRTQMAVTIRDYQDAIEAGDLSHDGSAIVRHIGNARRKDVSDEDEGGKRLFILTKDKWDSPRKIDYAMAAILSWKARLVAISKGIGKRRAWAPVPDDDGKQGRREEEIEPGAPGVLEEHDEPEDDFIPIG